MARRLAGGNKQEESVSRAQTEVKATRVCWCGATDFLPFGPEYGVCRTCGTLVYLEDMPAEQLLVRDDETDFYGKKYWLERQKDAFGHPDIHSRARTDLPERNLHWLKALLKYRLPPAEVMEVGCAHGSFVALMRQAGYRATGVEMSPWVVAFGRETFDIPVLTGPVESLDVPAGSLDAMVLMDVLEHLPDPTTTMGRCLELLKPEGMLLIQTPCLEEGASHAALVASKDRFLEMLIPQEHLYLFSKRSVTEFFHALGAGHIVFEPAIFDHYDMFFAVSRVPLKVHSPEEIASALMATPGGRLTLALLDLRERESGAEQQIHTLTDWVGEARAETAELREHQASALLQNQTLTGWIEDARAEAAALRESASAQAQLHTAEMATFNGLHENAVRQIDTLTGWVHEARAANAALQNVLEEQRGTNAAHVEQLNTLNKSAVQQIETLTGWVQEARAANTAFQNAMDEQREAHAAQMAELNNLNMSALKQIETLTAWVQEARAANAALRNEMDEQKTAHAREVGALRDLLARPMLKLVLRLSSIRQRLAKRLSGADRR